MNRYLPLSVVMVLLVMVTCGCIGGGADDDELPLAPDLDLHQNTGSNGMSTSQIEFAGHENCDHAVIVSILDKEESVEEHVVYLYLFDGAPPSTSSVDLDMMDEALEGDSLASFMMTWNDPEVTWEVDFDQENTDHFSYVMWNPDRDEYDDSTPDVHVDIKVYFSVEGNEVEEKNDGFREYDVTDFSEYNSEANPMSVMEMCDLLMENMEDISEGGMITAFTSGGFTGTGIDKETGECPGWQVYVQRVDAGQTYSKTIFIAENGWCVVMDDHEVIDYPVWDPDNSTVDSSDLISKVNSNETASIWLSEHPGAKLSIQSYHGPPIDSDEESFLMKYEGGDDALNVYISALDGNIIEVEDPNDWSFDW